MVKDTSNPDKPAAPEEPDKAGEAQKAEAKTPQGERGVLKQELEGVQANRKGDEASRNALSSEIEAQRDGRVERFFTGIFGKSFVTSFLTKLTSPFLGRFIGKEIPMEEFEEKFALAEKDSDGMPIDIEEFIISHRALGYGREKENSPEAVKAAIDGGEKQIEIDLRLGDNGEVYVVHDSIKGEDTPSEKHTSLKDMLEIFASHKNQDVAIYFDIKEVGVLDKLDAAIASIDGPANTGREGYNPIGKRHFVSSFNEELLARAHESNPDRPLIFNYIPTARLKGADKLVASMGHKKVGKTCRKIDKLYGTALERDLGTTIVQVDGEAIKGHPEGAKNRLNLYAELPPKKILSKVAYIGVPLALATKTLVANAHNAGVKVGVWGAEDSEIQYALGVLGVDMIISDNPDLNKGQPEEAEEAA
jgi:glycerophosphoryl diester phosphodiesterase